MKGYRYLVPVALVALMALSWYQLITTVKTEQQEYEATLERARSFAKQGIATDAVSNYNLALSMQESVELYQEISDYYHNYGSSDEQISWDLAFSEKYPENAEAYLPLMKDYYEKEQYAKCFQLYDTVVKRTESIEEINSIVESLKYEYFYKDSAFDEVSSYSAGFCAVKSGENWGYVDEGGSYRTSSSYAYAAPFFGDFAPVITNDRESYFIDKGGNKKKLMPEGVDVISPGGLYADRFVIFNGKDYGYYNTENTFLFGNFEYAGLLTYGRALVKEGGKWKIIDADGTQISENTYQDAFVDELGRTFQNNRAFVKDNSGWIMIDTEGNQVGNGSYDDVMLFAEENSLAAVKIGEEWGYIDMDGNQVIEPQFQEARSFSNGLAAVKKSGYWGYIDIEGNLVINNTFEGAKEFNSSKNAFVKQDGMWYMISLYQYNY